MSLTRITLTGADEQTSLAGLLSLSLCAPVGVAVEFGLLFSANPECRRRYPRDRWLGEAVTRLGQATAVHVCGRTARREVLAGDHSWIENAGRVQLNGRVTLDEVWRAALRFPEVITQYKPDLGLDSVTAAEIPRHSILVDASGGRGITPLSWSRPSVYKPVGFAGGLSPANLRRELPKIAGVAKGDWWIDMESSLRGSDDWFSLTQCLAALEACRAWDGKAA